ncbi:nuclear transport factor 2 family protein [Plantactinospora sp. S1510]|uniref:Nuclear transport factor 2 family protein n=1 Tax=Plantactinospora alkalitolerans TaxID=2789879 RepID=A0ABS0GVQ2_9ACTN|nr:nuclear transport factor 2 family protein [Plantactinospora alkalitolerans]MBF9130262.1 nuclear transport factor 2 family protein [Plantactinospora alkalitolerans]
MHPFRVAIEARDIDAAVALLSDDVVFRSPIAFKPYRGRAAVAPILRAVAQVFQDFRYVREIGAEDAADHALVFQARVADQQIEGSDFLHLDDHGAIDELVVMIRPLSGMLALRDTMEAQFTAARGAVQA